MRFDDITNQHFRSRDLAIDLEVLRSFIEVASLGNVTRAAEKLDRAQSTVSSHIAKIETVYGGEVFIRVARGVELTERGLVVRAAAERMLDIQGRTLATLHNSSLSGTLRVGIMDDYALDRFPRVLRRFAANNPNLTLRVEVALSAKLHEGIETGDIDIAVVRRRAGTSVGKTLVHEKLEWVAAHEASLPESEPIPLVMFDSACLYRSAVTDALKQRGVDFYVTATASSLAGVVASCFAGLGITVLSKSTIPQTLSVLHSDRLPLLGNTEVALVVSENAPLAAVELEKELFKEHESQ